MNYICMGEDCLPRSLLTFAKIKPSKSKGELTLPFDLMISDIKSIQNLLDENFDRFFENLISKPHNSFKNDGNFIQNVYDKFIFNHESEATCIGYNIKGSFYTEDDFREFKLRYQQRINNMIVVLSNEKKKCFIIHLVHIESYDYINTFIEFLFLKFGESIKIIIVYSLNTKAISTIEDERVFYFPYKLDGLWNTPPENLQTLVVNFINVYINE